MNNCCFLSFYISLSIYINVRVHYIINSFILYIASAEYYLLLQLIRDADAAVDRIHRLLDGLEILLEDTI